MPMIDGHRVAWIPRRRLAQYLQAATRNPEYLFSVYFRTRNSRRNQDGTIRPAGAVRHIRAKRKANNFPTRNWIPKGGRLNYNPAAHDLFKCYTVEGKAGDNGTGNHWAMVCLRSAFCIKNKGWIIFIRGCRDSEQLHARLARRRP